MTLWLNRAGQHGEFESKFLDENRVYLTWDGLNRDLSKVDSRESLLSLLHEVYPDAGVNRLKQNSNQIWAFVKRMQVGDWIALPSKKKPAIHLAEIKGNYTFDAKAEDPFFHDRKVKWIATDIPRTNFDQDLLYSFGAFSTICQIQRNDAEARVKAMAANGWKSTKLKLPSTSTAMDDEQDDEVVELERLGRDNIAKLIMAKFKGHGMALLVEGVLKAQGYTTFRSLEGPDKGIDILAGTGPLGFSSPRIAVQVKSADAPSDRPTVDQLIGAMQNVHADQGLFVSWGGFKTSVDRERATQFFRVRLWDQDELIEQILDNYDKLSDDLRAELPLKRIWTVAEDPEASSSDAT